MTIATTDNIRQKFARSSYDAIVVGSGPNGLAAAIFLLKKGLSAVVVEANSTAGGGCRSAELTLPGFVHDLCSSIHPLGVGSPFFRTLPLERYGFEWIYPKAAYAHPLDDGRALLAHYSIDETAAQLGRDGYAYQRLMRSLRPDWDRLCEVLLKPLELLKYPLPFARFSWHAMQSTQTLCHRLFAEESARALFTGVCAHSALRVDAPASASFGLVLGIAAHTVGWPTPKGGAQKLTDALVAHMLSLGGELVLDTPVCDLKALPDSRFVFLDVTPAQLLKMAHNWLPTGYRKQMEQYKYGPGSYKMDWALDGPIPWAAPECSQTATVHLGGTFEEIAVSEDAVWRGECSRRPYVLLVQTSLFDSSRAPAGKHTAWAYCHVPNGSQEAMHERIENQIERFAPGFKNLIIARSILTPADLQAKNANYIGGDISGGALNFRQLVTRPALRLIPYKTPLKGVYFCSSATPPGGGVHGMCGYYAAQAALLSHNRG